MAGAPAGALDAGPGRFTWRRRGQGLGPLLDRIAVVNLEERAVRLRREGHKYREIMLALGISQSFLVRALHEAGLVQEQDSDRRWPFGGALGLPVRRPRRRPAHDDPDHESNLAKSYLEYSKDRIRLVRRAGVRMCIEPEDCLQEALLVRLSHPDISPMHYVAMARMIDASVASCEVPHDLGRKAIMCMALGDEAHPALSADGGEDDASCEDQESWRRAKRLAAEFAAWPNVDFEVMAATPGRLFETLAAREEVAMLLHAVKDERARLIVSARHGLIDGIERTLEEVGEALNLTMERVRQIEAAALERMAVRARRVEAERSAGIHAKEPSEGWLKVLPGDFSSWVSKAKESIPAELHEKRKAIGRFGAKVKKKKARGSRKRIPAAEGQRRNRLA